MSDLDDYKREEERLFRRLEAAAERAATDENASLAVDMLIARGMNPLEFMEPLRSLAPKELRKKSEVDDWLAKKFRELANRARADGQIKPADD